MTTIELEEIKIARQAARRQIENLDSREREIRKHMKDAHETNLDAALIKPDVTEGEANYCLGQSAGYVDGFKAALYVITDALSCQYRDIPITEDELFMLVSLGEFKERAYIKDCKSKEIAEKSGWEFVWGRSPHWKKKEQKEAETEGEG